MVGTSLALVLAVAPALRVGSDHHFLEAGVVVQGRFTVQGALDGEAEESAELKRLRLALRGAFDGELVTLGVQLNTTAAALEVLDLWLGWTPTRGVTLEVGQLKTPFTRHRAGSFRTLPLVDWSLAAVHFGSERQVGARLELKTRSSRSAFGVFTGTNARAAFARGPAQLYGVPLVNRSDLRVAAPIEPIHPELVALTGLELTDAPVKTSAFVSAAWDLRPTRGVDFQLRLAPELRAQWRTVTLELVGYAGWAPDRFGVLIGLSVGGTAELSWRPHRHLLVAARWSRVDLLPAARFDALASGAGGARAASQQELTAGVTWLPPGPLKLQLDGSSLTAPEGLRLRLQAQLAI